MGRPKGSRNKRTLLKEAEQHVGSKYVDQVIDSLYVIETATRHFFNRAEMGEAVARTRPIPATTPHVHASSAASEARRHLLSKCGGGLLLTQASPAPPDTPESTRELPLVPRRRRPVRQTSAPLAR